MVKGFTDHRFQKAAKVGSTALSVAALACTLAGCGMTGAGGGGTSQPTSPLVQVQGHLHGGAQPIVGASIHLYAAGTTGATYGSGSTEIPLSPAVTTGSDGGFSLTGKYVCPGLPTATSEVYIVATGGDSGAGTNSKIALMAALGPCVGGGNLLASVPYIWMDEVTTVSSVWALQNFMAPPSVATPLVPAIGAPGTSYATGTALGSVQSGVVGLRNAFTVAGLLADLSTGQSPNANFPYAQPDTSKINAFADILAYCINSSDAVTNCDTLMGAVTPSGATAAQDTIQAAWYLAQNHAVPAAAAALIGSIPPYQPYTSSTGLTDSTIAITFDPHSGTNLSVGAPYNIAIDAYGNAWLSNAGYGTAAAGAVEIGVDGSTLAGPTATFTAPGTNGSVSQFTTPPGSTVRTLTTPRGVAVDLAGRAWIANYGDSYQATTSLKAGTVAVFYGSSTTGLNGLGGGIGSTGYWVGYQPSGLAIDGANNVFVTNSGSSALDSGAIGKLISDPGNADDGTYTYSSSSSTSAPNVIPTSTSELAIDSNPLVPGGIVWAVAGNGCNTAGVYGTATKWGTIGEFSATSLAPLTDSDAVTAYSNATVGAGGSTNCGSVSTYVGQTFTAPTANPTGIAVDRNNGVWIVDEYTGSLGFDGVTYLQPVSGVNGMVGGSAVYHDPASPLPNSGAAIHAGSTALVKPGSVAVDGDNNAWVTNQSQKSVVELATDGTTITVKGNSNGGSYGHNNYGSLGIAVDPSGNVWVVNNTNSGSYTYKDQTGAAIDYRNDVVMLVGAGGPTVTPLSLAVKAGKLGSRP